MDKNIILGISLAVSVAISGCDSSVNEADALAEAEFAFAEKNYTEASIHLKKILQTNSEHVAARYLLGQIYLNSGSWVKAEKEFLKALEFGLEDASIYPKLAKTYYYLEDLVGLDDLVGLNMSAEHKQAVVLYLGRLQIKVGNVELAKSSFLTAVKVNNESAYGKLSSAYLSIINKDNEKALSQSKEILSEYPLFSDVHELQGFLNYQLRKYPESAEAFKQFLAMHINANAIRLMYASALSKSGDIEQAEKEVDYLLKGAPNNPLLNEIKAEAHYSRKEYRDAKLAAEKTLNVQKNRTMASIIAGASAYEVNELEIAYTHLQHLEGFIPLSHPAMILLNTIRFELGYVDDAFMSFNNSSDINLSSQILSASAKELLMQGRDEQANALIDKALSKAPDDPNLLFQKGISNISQDKTLAKEFLSKSIEKDPKNQTAIGLLAHAYISDGMFDEAISLIEAIEPLHNNYALQLFGITYKAKGDLTQSEKYFSMLVKNMPEDYQGYIGLGSLALLKEDRTAAIQHYDNAYKLKSYKALNQLVSLSLDEKYTEQITLMFKEYSQLEDEHSFFKVGYAELLLKHGEIGSANTEIDKALKVYQSDKEVLMFKSKILILARQYPKALQILDNLLIENNDDFIVLEHKAHLLSLMKEFSKAKVINEKLRKSRPQSIKYLVDLIDNNVNLGELKTARELVKQLNLMPNTSVIASRFNGKMLFIEQKYQQAISPLMEAYAKRQSLDVLVEIIQSKQFTGQYNSALMLLLDYEKQHEKLPSILQFKKAELMQANGRSAEAVETYQNLVSLLPKNVAAINNLAWLYFTEGDFELAKDSALKAYELDSNNDYVNHTLGLSQLYTGNVKEAVTLLNKFSDTTNESFKVALIEALIASQQMSQAKALYEKLDSNTLSEEALTRYKNIKF